MSRWTVIGTAPTVPNPPPPWAPTVPEIPAAPSEPASPDDAAWTSVGSLPPGPKGDSGPPGPQGPSGPAGESFYQAFNIALPTTTWVLIHNQNSYGLAVETVDTNGDPVEGNVRYVDADRIEIDWYYPTAGTARIFR